MHELSVASAVVATACGHAGGRRVTKVSVRVGRLRQVMPDSLRFYFEIVTRDGLCEGAVLELEEIEVALACRACRRTWHPEIPAFRCPDCDAADVAIEAGEELEVDYIEVEDPVEDPVEDRVEDPVEDKEPECIGPR